MRDVNQKVGDTSFIVNKPSIHTNGTYLVGSVTTSYPTLVNILGEEHGYDEDVKTQCNWNIEGELDGEKVVATIYDWKQYGVKKEHIIRWNVGGYSHKALELVKTILNQ